MTTQRLFTYSVTLASGCTITVAAANKVNACLLASDFHGAGRWVQIVRLARSTPQYGYRAVSLPNRTRYFSPEGAAPL